MGASSRSLDPHRQPVFRVALVFAKTEMATKRRRIVLSDYIAKLMNYLFFQVFLKIATLHVSAALTQCRILHHVNSLVLFLSYFFLPFLLLELNRGKTKVVSCVLNDVHMYHVQQS